MLNLIERQCRGIGAGDAGQLADGDEKREQRDAAEGDRVARGGKRHAESGLDAERVAEVAAEFGEGIALDAEGGELPHTGKEGLASAICGLDEEGAAMRVEKDGGSETNVFRWTLIALRWDGILKAEGASAAETSDGTFGA